MSIIREVYLTLETIVTTSDVIVEVEALEPFEESVPVPSDNPDKSIPDFIKRGIIFRVKRILKNTSNASVPETLHVPNENWRRFFSQHKEQYANGPSKSFSVNAYQTKVISMNEAEILFLSRFQDTFQLIARESFESLASVKIIEKWI